MEVPQNWNQSCERPEEKGVYPENLHRFCLVLLKSTLFLTGEGGLYLSELKDASAGHLRFRDDLHRRVLPLVIQLVTLHPHLNLAHHFIPPGAQQNSTGLILNSEHVLYPVRMLIIVYVSGDCLVSVSCHYEVLRASLEMRYSTSVHIINTSWYIGTNVTESCFSCGLC